MLAFAWLALVSGDVLAQASQCGVEREVKPKPLDEPTWNRLNRIYEYVGEEDYDSAYKELITLQERSEDKGDYLNAIIYQALGQVQWSLEDYDSALRSFEQAVEKDALPNDPHFSLMYQIAQLYYMKERYRDALSRLELWFCKVPPEKIKPHSYVLKASSHAQLKEWPKVIESIDKAIAMAEEPKESWYTLKLASNYELEDFPAAAETLEVMIKLWPDKKMYWTQLSNVWFKLQQDEKALSVIALAHRKQLLDKQADYLYLSNLYSLREVPFKAAEVIQEGLEAGIIEATAKHWTYTADAWYAAEEMERALAAYEKAGQLSEDGEIDLRRGYILIDLERWAEARDALRLALSKGGLNDRKTGEAHLMVGMSEFNLGNWDRASAAWGRASRYERSRKSAQQWMNLLREERARKAS
jgi:tetratricopeptide (TPR) repeat protein